MSDVELIASVVRRLLMNCGLVPTGSSSHPVDATIAQTESLCVNAFRNPSSALFAIQPAVLSKIMRVMKGKPTNDKMRNDVEDCFMKLVTKDNGCLPEILRLIANALGDVALLEMVATATKNTVTNNNSTTNSVTNTASSTATTTSTRTIVAGSATSTNNNVLRVPPVTVIPQQQQQHSLQTNISAPAVVSASTTRSQQPTTTSSSSSASINTNNNTVSATAATARGSDVIPPPLPAVNNSVNGTTTRSLLQQQHTPTTTSSSSPSFARANITTNTAPTSNNTATLSPQRPVAAATTSTSSSSEAAAVGTRHISSAPKENISASAYHSTLPTNKTGNNDEENNKQSTTVGNTNDDPANTSNNNSIGIYDCLMAYTQETEKTPSASTLTSSPSSSSSSVPSDAVATAIDSSVLRYGSHVVIRNVGLAGGSAGGIGSSASSGSILSTSTTSSSSSSSSYNIRGTENTSTSVSLCRTFSREGHGVFAVLHAQTLLTSSTGIVADGAPVRCGDVIVLRCVSTGKYLGGASTVGSSSTSSNTNTNTDEASGTRKKEDEEQFPDVASTDAKGAYMNSGVMIQIPSPSSSTSSSSKSSSVSTTTINAIIPTLSERWTILSPHSVIAAHTVAVKQWNIPATRKNKNSNSNTVVLPRPYITAGSGVLLLSHASSSTSATSVATANSVQSSAQAAMARMQLLLAGTVFPSSSSSSKSTTNSELDGKRSARTGPLIPFSKAYIDSASRYVAGSSSPSSSSSSSSSQESTNNGSGRLGPLAPAGIAHALMVSPPSGALWAFLPISKGSGVASSSSSSSSGSTKVTTSSNNYSSPLLVLPPSWATDAETSHSPHLTGTFVLPPELLPYTSHRKQSALAFQATTKPPSSASSSPTAVSEAELITALFDAMQGIPSIWIHANITAIQSSAVSPGMDWDSACASALTGDLLESVEFIFSSASNSSTSSSSSTSGRPALDPAVVALASRMLPLAKHVVRCSWYVERRSRYGSGLTAQALAAAARALLQEFSHLLVRLEALLLRPAPGTPALSLQQLWYYLQPSLRTLSALDSILYAAPHAKGGALLTAIANVITGSGDESVRTLANFLIERASVPLLRWVEKWVFDGNLDDPFEEFFVRDIPGVPHVLMSSRNSNNNSTSSTPVYGNDAFWERRFVLDTSLVPSFLAPHAQAILTTGKYLHILRLCRGAAGPLQLMGRFLEIDQQEGGGQEMNNIAASASLFGGASSTVAAALSANASMMATNNNSTSSAEAALARMAATVLSPRAAGKNGGGNNQRRSGSVTGISGGAFPFTTFSNASSSSSSSVSGGGGGAAMSPSKTSTAIGADVNVGRSLAPSETVSALDSVFNSRRQSVANSVVSSSAASVIGGGGGGGGGSSSSSQSVLLLPSELPAAGLPSSSVPAPPGSLFGLNVDRITADAAAAAAAATTSTENGSGSASATSKSPQSTKNGINGGEMVIHGMRSSGAENASSTSALGASLSAWVTAAATAAGDPTKALCPTATALSFSLDPQVYAPHINAAYSFASRALLHCLYAAPPPLPVLGWGNGYLDSNNNNNNYNTNKNAQVLAIRSIGGDLLGRLSSLKTFLLMAQGDWLVHFLDAAESELSREVPLPHTSSSSSSASAKTASANASSSLSLPRLRALLDQSLRASSSIAAEDPYRSSITAALAPSSLLAQLDHIASKGAKPLPTSVAGLKGYNVFVLEFNVPWPASLVLSRSALAKYQLLFRHVFFLRYVERAVALSWRAHQACKELGRGLRSLLALSFSLRQRMLHFLQNMAYFVTVEVLEPQWHELVVGLRGAVTVDDVLARHTAFLDSCLASSLLTSPELLKQLTRIVTLCLLFSDQMSKAIEDHRLTEEELDAKVGLNKAGARARAQREVGEYYVEDENNNNNNNTNNNTEYNNPSANGVGQKQGTGNNNNSRRRQGGGSGGGSSSTPILNPGLQAKAERERRVQRLAIQEEAMTHQMAQAGWQAMIDKSCRIFDGLLAEFTTALQARAARADVGAVSSSSSSQGGTSYMGGGGGGLHLAHLLERLDFNGFYSMQQQQQVGK